VKCNQQSCKYAGYHDSLLERKRSVFESIIGKYTSGIHL
jgi:hypothetical protein